MFAKNQFGLYKKNRKLIHFIDINRLTKIKKIKIAVIIPYRNREQHLAQFIRHFNNLDASKLNGSTMDVYIIEQNNDDKFNRGLLINIGYLMASRNYDYDRYILHDVDLFPNQTIYELYFSYPKKQVHYIIPKYEHKYNFNSYLGGVVGLSSQCFEKINGFPNNFFGWGGEDDAMYDRLAFNNIPMYRPTIGEYELVAHEGPKKEEINVAKQQNILNDLKNWKNNGVTQLRNALFINIEKDENVLKSFPEPTNTDIKYSFYKINYLGENTTADNRVIDEIKNLSASPQINKLLKEKRKRCTKGHRKSNMTKKCTKRY